MYALIQTRAIRIDQGSASVLYLYGRLQRYPTPYEADSSARWMLSNDRSYVEASINVNDGQWAYFAVHNPTTTDATFQLMIESTEGVACPLLASVGDQRLNAL